MKELVVISGKGGTGKTSIVASFAALAEKSVLADCDVDAADLHLLLEPHIQDKHKFKAGKKAVIREKDCTACGICLDYCRFDAVRNTDGKPGEDNFSIDPISCEGCGVCVHFCPEKAIDFIEKTCGEWFISETRHGPMVHARLGIAEENSGKLVTLVRTQARMIAEKRGYKLVMIDGPPGIGCPVIASITGTDLVLAVTEPTLSGLHDLERVVRLAQGFKIPVKVCINKYDINQEMTGNIESYCRKQGLGIAGRIPYDPAVTRAQIAYSSIVEHSNAQVAKDVRRMWSEVSQAMV